MAEIDNDLQALVEAGCPPRSFNALARRHAGWVRQVAVLQWRAWRDSHRLYEVEDVEQLVLATMWRACCDYKWICKDMNCRQYGRDWRTGDHGVWLQHVWAKHPPKSRRCRKMHQPRVDVGRYVRFNVRAWTNAELKKESAARRTATMVPLDHLIIDERTLSEAMGKKGWKVAVRVRGMVAQDLRTTLRELTDEAARSLSPLAARMLVRLTEGYSGRQAVALEVEGVTDPTRRKLIRGAARRAKKFMSRAGETLLC